MKYSAKIPKILVFFAALDKESQMQYTCIGESIPRKAENRHEIDRRNAASSCTATANRGAGAPDQRNRPCAPAAAASSLCAGSRRAEIPATQKRDWKPLIFPLAAAVLNLGALALWLTLPNCVTPENSGWMGRFALCIVAQSVSLCAAIGSIVSAMRRKPPKPVAVADETEFRRRLVEVEGRIALDAQTIEALFAQESVTIISTGAETAAELYASLYEMAQDARLDGDANQGKALSWPLSNAKRLLNAVGCEAVDYTPETAMFYDVMDADITQQRRPAIVQKADGIVQQRGLYLRKG